MEGGAKVYSFTVSSLELKGSMFEFVEICILSVNLNLYVVAFNLNLN